MRRLRALLPSAERLAALRRAARWSSIRNAKGEIS